MGINYMDKITKPGVYQLNDNKNKYAAFSDIEKQPICFYETDSVQLGTLKITKLDTTNHIIAGTFEFTVWTEECDTIRVTDGRFDINYR